jgi:hypothetical protein
MAQMDGRSNLSEFDTTKTVDVKGPMLDPILGYEGDGELPTYKDAASVLERYYFGEKRSEHEISEMDYENDKGDSSGKSMKHTEGPEGEEQAGTSNADTPTGSEKEKEKDIAKESKQFSEKEMNTADLKSKNMKDAEGPEDEEQAGTGDTYKDFKKRVVESIEEIVGLVEQDHDEEEETPEEEEEESDEMQKKEEEEGKEPESHKKNMKEAQGVVPPPALQKKMKNEDSGEEYEDEADAKGEGKKDVKESDEIELDIEEDITEALENEIIEKIISEMEDESSGLLEQDEEPAPDGDEGEEDEDEDEDEDEGLDVDKKMEEMVNRLTSESDTMKHTEGPEGEEQAGTGGDEKVIPPRKDRSNEGDKSKGTKPMDKSELADA